MIIWKPGLEDKGQPSLFSKTNGIILSSIPTEIDGLTQTEEMLIAKALPILNIYLPPGGQKGYFDHCINLPQAVSDVAYFSLEVQRLLL